MIKNLRFVRAAEGQVIFTPKPGATIKVTTDEQGHLKPGPTIVTAYDRKADRSEFSVIRMRREDATDFISAVSWASEDMIDFTLQRYETGKFGASVPVPLESKNGLIEVTVPGRFSPSLTPDDIQEIVTDWKLLSVHFDHRREIFKSVLPGSVTEQLFYYLLDKLDRKRDAKLESWIERFLQLRREASVEKS